MLTKPVAATSVAAAEGRTIYPHEFAAVVAGRTKRKLGEMFGLSNFGINCTTLEPGAASALMHDHSKQDEFVYILEGTATIRVGSQTYTVNAGECCGFRAGAECGHQVANQSIAPVVYLEIGDRTIGDLAEFPEDDLKANQGENGQWVLTHKNGEPYQGLQNGADLFDCRSSKNRFDRSAADCRRYWRLEIQNSKACA